jgi:C4-dicarboxylate transporter, DctM subunit
MNPSIIGWIGLVCLFALMAMGMPIGFAMGLIGLVGFGMIAGFAGALTQLGIVPYASVASYTLTVLPLFILMGEFAFLSGMIRGAFSGAHKLLGHLPGGLAMATISGCAAFAAVCGSSVATAATMGTVALPEMQRYKYKPELSTGSIACGGTLGILIPPSTPMVIYAVFANESVGKLFMGGFLPGILLTALFIIVILIWVKISPSTGPRGPNTTWRVRFGAFKDIWPVFILAFLVLGGIWGGIFSPTEAAGVGAFGAFIIGLVRKQLKLKSVLNSLSDTIKTTAMVFTILIGAMIFNYFIVICGIPKQLAEMVASLSLPPLGILICILFVYFLLGCLMDTMAMTVLTLPIFLPILHNLGFDLVWFGIIFVIMCEMALVTPPMGMNVFVISGMAKGIPMYTIFRGIFPFLAAMVICLVLVIAFPQIVMFLPNSMID